jgi:hypothetical protein
VLLEGELLGVLDALDDEKPLLTGGEGPSDAVDPSSPLTLGATTSDDDVDPAGPSLTALDVLEALAAVVVDVEGLVRCNAARTDAGDSGAGR